MESLNSVDLDDEEAVEDLLEVYQEARDAIDAAIPRGEQQAGWRIGVTGRVGIRHIR